MKKYLKYIKTLQLAKGILAGSIFLIYSSYALASDNKLYFLNGKVDTIESDSSDCSVSVVSQGLKSWMYTDKKNICDFLQHAKGFDQKVNFEYTLGNGYESIKTRNKLKGVNFAGKQSIWFTNKDGIEESYSLKGNIEDIYYNAVNSRCYIAINDPRPSKTKYNNKFHETNSKSICELAEDAFYLGLKVEIQASLDPHPDYANDIRILKLVNSCSNLRSH